MIFIAPQFVDMGLALFLKRYEKKFDKLLKQISIHIISDYFSTPTLKLDLDKINVNSSQAIHFIEKSCF